ncbi:hypothetical protein BH11ARM2_BH11ARM2_39280 [soil metagenome]
MRLASLGLLALTSLAFAGDDGAKAAFFRSMRRTFPVNVVTVIIQRDPKNEGVMQTIRMERDKRGRFHHTVIQPLRLAGIESADDGERARVYWPDQNLLIDQASPLLDPDDAPWRMKVAEANYSFKFGEKAKIAGRDAIEVIAQPHYGAMETRHFFLDAKIYYPLRITSVQPDGKETLYLDTKDILFPKQLSDDKFALKPVGAVKTLRYERPERMNVAEVTKRLGFEPMLPQQIPMGFKIQEMQLTDSNDWHAAKIFINDGLVRATVYQWNAKYKVRLNSIENSSFTEYRGLRMLLVCEIAPSLRDQLLAAFVERAEAEAQIGQLGPFGTLSQDLGVERYIQER